MKEQFIAQLENHFRTLLAGLTPLQKTIRERAWERFREVGLAEKKDAGYQYFPLHQFYQETYEIGGPPTVLKGRITSLIHPECRRRYIAFVNGQYSPELSDTTGLPPEVVVIRLKDALNNYGNFLQGRLSRTLKEETDPFALLNITLIQMGLFIYVPPQVVIDAPIQCIHLVTNDRPALVNPRIHFFLGKEAKLNWISEHHCSSDFEYFSNGAIDIALEEGAIFNQYGVLNPCPNGWCFEATRVTQKRDSQFKNISLTTGAKSVRQDFRIALMGENASCDLKGVSVLSENRQAHFNILVDHQAPHCRSNQHFKNILSGTSRSSFEGKIYVHPKAQKTEAYQLNNNLLLSDKAIANSKPNLEIFADDVKASHGATVSQLKSEHLFYLKTRGIAASDAKMMLLMSFCLDLFDQVPITSVREQMQQLVTKYLA